MAHYDFYMTETAQKAQFGQYGLRVLTGNATVGETFVAVQAVADSVISSTLVALPSGENGDTTITSLALSRGMIIYGRFVDLQVASGKVIAYKG